MDPRKFCNGSSWQTRRIEKKKMYHVCSIHKCLNSIKRTITSDLVRAQTNQDSLSFGHWYVNNEFLRNRTVWIIMTAGIFALFKRDNKFYNPPKMFLWAKINTRYFYMCVIIRLCKPTPRLTSSGLRMFCARRVVTTENGHWESLTQKPILLCRIFSSTIRNCLVFHQSSMQNVDPICPIWTKTRED